MRVYKIAEVGTTMFRRLSELYLLAERGSLEARRKVRALTVAEREAICPPALRGRTRRAFVLHGLTFAEYVERVQSGALVGAEALDDQKGKEQDEVKEMGTSVIRTRKKTRRTVPDKPDLLRHGRMTAASVARRAGIDGRKFRDYLRAVGLARQFSTQRDASRAVRAYLAWEDLRSGGSSGSSGRGGAGADG